MGKVLCEFCSKKCSGNVLRVGKTYFHIDCFKCQECETSLSTGGFFSRTSNSIQHYYCTNCYQKSFGTKCAACHEFVEGEVVTALGNTYHQNCFRCSRCKQPFPTGDKVTWNGRECLCAKCVQIPVVSSQTPDGINPKCSACDEDINEGQALIALDKQWHIWCFKCESCKSVLHGEYMSKDGKVYCEKDYQRLFGIKCNHCERYITGKVLQAGENHFHPTCARCTKCGDTFGDGEEMFMQGGAIWHPRCGPGPDGKMEVDAPIDLQYYPQTYSPSLSDSISRSASPYDSKQLGHSISPYTDKDSMFNDLNRVYTYSYLAAEPTQGYLRRPLEPRPPKSPQFHRPPESYGRRRVFTKSLPKHGMQALIDNLQTGQPRPKSPAMNNEEPLELAHYPGAQKPKPNDIPRIERDDFPAPPFPYTDPERVRRWSGNSKDADLNNIEADEDEVDQTNGDSHLKKEEHELSKIATGIGKVFLKTVQEREKIMAYKRSHIDPRKSSRTPSAKTELSARLRYENPVNASPSRDMDRPKPWEDEEIERGSHFRSSYMGRYVPPINYNVVSSLRNVPKPGYLQHKSSTLPSRDIHLNGSDSPFTDRMIEKTQSIDFSSGKSDISAYSEQPHDKRQYINHSISGTFRTTPFSDGFGGYRYASYSPHFRRSMPNVNFHLHSNDPPRQYPYHLLVTNNYRLPPDVDRCHLERHLQNSEFEQLFHMNRIDFYRLPEWRRNEMKRRVKLF
ncbi:actin-binding LIM protein 2-like [Oppia nitens]|uniref:actin-binding LIM protein 2-like n=1 Tax=Oppia nitens TaxID=1686743 RepID=UPI0023DA0EDD|nr:actin-binding LIM protein 2-like [Oppia nitens]